MSPEVTIAWKAAILGVVEGLTEFLPVSSTGHLIVVSHLLDYGSPEFEIVIQLGAMLALTWVYRERLVRMAVEASTRPLARLFILKVLLAFLPAVVVGLLVKDYLDALFRPGIVATTLIVGGFLILAIDRPRRFAGLADLERMTFRQALLIGIGQTLAMVPGVSRSGATIVTGLVVGLDRRAATDFSFLLALPTMYAATLYTLWDTRDALAGELGFGMAVGLVTAYVSALVVINAFLRYVQTSSLRPFGWYRIVVGAGVFVWLLLA
ncbi:MAG TPA: undecaprenyl-diphosphate phosphatase [Candidatus Binatia bacterium]